MNISDISQNNMKLDHNSSSNSESFDSGEKAGIGTKIRHLRKSKKISIQKLAEMSKLTPSTISQLERNLTNPSIPALRRIAATLGVPVFYFFMDEKMDESLLIVRSHSRKKLINPSRNVSIELLSPDLKHRMEVIEMTLEPWVKSSNELFTHEGEEACTVSEGKMTIQLGDRIYELNKGDCIQFNSDIPHRYINDTNSVTKLIVILTPPSF